MILPHEAQPLLSALAPAFATPSFYRFTTLLAAAILTTGRRTVANLLRTLGSLATGHRTSYQRLLSSARWSGLQLACLLSRFLLQHLLPQGIVRLVGDDTVDGHKGKKVHGKARHRDPVRSTKSYTTWRYGHKWVVLSVLISFPFATRPWALPILVDLYYSEDDNRKRNRPHRTPAQLMCRLLRVILLWFPQRTFLFVGDSSYGTHEVARFVARHRDRLTLVSKLHPQANLFEPPPPYTGTGRPRVKGQRLPKPLQLVQTARRQRQTVGWYGGGNRRVETVTGTGCWYKSGRGLVPLRWVFVHDRDGTHRDEYFFCTDPALTAEAIISHYTARWNIETTFQELRAHLGLETTRGWCANTVLRAAPCLFGLYTVVALLYQALPESQRLGSVCWPGKQAITFSDALSAVRRWLWSAMVFPQAGDAAAIEKLPEPLREIILLALAPAS
jgi:DDE superfamily endonuclease/Archaeal putative transposase ISC1217